MCLYKTIMSQEGKEEMRGLFDDKKIPQDEANLVLLGKLKELPKEHQVKVAENN